MRKILDWKNKLLEVEKEEVFVMNIFSDQLKVSVKLAKQEDNKRSVSELKFGNGEGKLVMPIKANKNTELSKPIEIGNINGIQIYFIAGAYTVDNDSFREVKLLIFTEDGRNI